MGLGSVFLINVPVAALALAGGALLLNESKAPHQRSLDIPGVLLSAAGLAVVTYGLITGPDDGWLSGGVLGSLIAGIALVVVFIWWELRQAEPLVDLTLFRNRTFSSAVGAVTAVFFALFGASYLLSQFIQFVQGVNSFGVGLRFVPMAVGTLIAANLAVRITARVTEGPLGKAPRGLLIYLPDGHMSVNMMRTEGTSSRTGTHDYMGYAGKWRYHGSQVVHTVGITPTAPWVDTDQVRDIALSADGQCLTLDGTALVEGKQVRRRLVWQRVTPLDRQSRASLGCGQILSRVHALWVLLAVVVSATMSPGWSSPAVRYR